MWTYIHKAVHFSNPSIIEKTFMKSPSIVAEYVLQMTCGRILESTSTSNHKCDRPVTGDAPGGPGTFEGGEGTKSERRSEHCDIRSL